MLGPCRAAAAIHLAVFMPLTIIDLSVPILLYTVAVRYGWAVSLMVLARGEAVVAPTVTRRLLDRYVTTGPAGPAVSATGVDTLTDREREVLGLSTRGLSNGEIAGRLYLSEGTVKTHVSRVLAKPGLA